MNNAAGSLSLDLWFFSSRLASSFIKEVINIFIINIVLPEYLFLSGERGREGGKEEGRGRERERIDF